MNNCTKQLNEIRCWKIMFASSLSSTPTIYKNLKGRINDKSFNNIMTICIKQQ